jgi:hypothetical protein
MIRNFDIEKICGKLDLPLIGVFNKDLLPNERKVGSYYINLQNHNDGDGTHWVLAKIYSDDERDKEEIIATNRRGERVIRCNALYFDPFGIDMPQEVERFLKPFKPIPFNNRQIQNIKSEVCGWYCLGCDYSLEHKQHSDTYLEDYEKFLALWDDNPNKNMGLLKSLFKPL